MAFLCLGFEFLQTVSSVRILSVKDKGTNNKYQHFASISFRHFFRDEAVTLIHFAVSFKYFAIRRYLLK